MRESSALKQEYGWFDAWLIISTTASGETMVAGKARSHNPNYVAC